MPRADAKPDRVARARGHRPAAQARAAASRVARAWRALVAEQRLAAGAALGLFVTMLLPWYTKASTFVIRGAPRTAESTSSAFGAFSFVEAAVLLVSAFVLAVLFARGEGRAFHLPGGDGTTIGLAGAWAALLIFYRMLDKPGLSGNQVVAATEGVTWGIFVALLVAIGLAYSGWRIRSAGRPEPPLLLAPRAAPPPSTEPTEALEGVELAHRDGPLSGEVVAESAATEVLPVPGARRRRRPSPRSVIREDAAQLSFDDPPSLDPFGERPGRDRTR